MIFFYFIFRKKREYKLKDFKSYFQNVMCVQKKVNQGDLIIRGWGGCFGFVSMKGFF